MKIQPTLRWAGGKRWLVNKIDRYLPSEINNYYEPFAGGLSILIHLLKSSRIQNLSFASDTNSELINFYSELKDNPETLIRELKKYHNSEDEYYDERSRIRRAAHTKAAKFLYLNRTSFNGIYRENLQGQYNVPYGHKTYTNLFDTENITNLSKLLEDTLFQCIDFEEICENAEEGDLIFFDPPYTVAHENNGFVKYNQNIFKWEDQIRLRDLIIRLDERGVNVILTNAKHKSINKLYRGAFEIQPLSRSSTIGGKGAIRKKYNEVIIRNR